MDGDVIVCRCESVRYGELTAASAASDRNVTQIKHLTRAGMGVCGGRTCRPLLDQLLGRNGDGVTFSHRIPVRPVTVGDLAATPLAEGQAAAASEKE